MSDDIREAVQALERAASMLSESASPGEAWFVRGIAAAIFDGLTDGGPPSVEGAGSEVCPEEMRGAYVIGVESIESLWGADS